MADDALGLKGFAQVVQQSNGNLYALSRLAQQGAENQRNFDLKRQETANKAYDDAVNGLYVAKNLDPILQNADRQHFMDSVKAMSEMHKSAARTGDYEGLRTSLGDVKANSDQFSRGLESVSNTAKTIQDLVLNDKQGMYNKESVGSALNDLKTKALMYDDKGNVVGINYDEAAKISKVLDNPDFYNKTTVAKLWAKDRAVQEISSLEENNNSFRTRTDKLSSDLFETESDGRGNVKLKLTSDGHPIPKATPEAVADFRGEIGSVHDKILNSWAETLPRLKNGGLDIAGAFKKFVVEPHGMAEVGKTTINEKSAGLADRADQKVLTDERYDTLNKIVNNPTESSKGLLSQSFDPKGDFNAEYVYSNAGGGGNSKPTAIRILHRETITAQDPITSFYTLKKGDWTKYEDVPIGTEQEKDAAIYKINSLLNSAQGEKKSIDQGVIKRIHENSKKNQPIKLGF